MAEKIGRRSVQIGTNSALVTLPSTYVEDMKFKKGDFVEVLREGDSLIIRPERKASVDPAGVRGT